MILCGPDVSIDAKLWIDPDGDTNSQSCGARLRAAPTSRVSQTPLDQLTRSSTSDRQDEPTENAYGDLPGEGNFPFGTHRFWYSGSVIASPAVKAGARS